MPLGNEIGAQLWYGACPADDKRYIVSYGQEGLRLNELNEKNELVTQIDLEAVISDYCRMPCAFKTDKNGLLYFIGLDTVYVLDEHGTLLFSQTYGGGWIFGYKDKENEVHIVRSAKNADYMYDESQNKFVEKGEAFPVRNDSMEDLLERMSATETYTKEDGTVIRAVDQYSIGINDYDIVPKALREEDIAKFKDMLDRSVVCDGLSEEQIDVIWEEVQSFLTGSQDKETAIRNIQSRISVTVQE